MKSPAMLSAVAALLALAGSVLPARAVGLVGTKTVTLITPAGDKTVIGKVELKPAHGGYTFAITFKTEAFSVLYMRESNFLCLETQNREVCHFPYPPGDYAPDDVSGVISDGDLRALEYALLFVEMRKPPEEVDFNPFNGLYYKLKIVDGHIEGTVHGVDFTSTYPDGAVGKYVIERLDEVDMASQRFPRLVIE